MDDCNILRAVEHWITNKRNGCLPWCDHFQYDNLKPVVVKITKCRWYASTCTYTQVCTSMYTCTHMYKCVYTIDCTQNTWHTLTIITMKHKIYVKSVYYNQYLKHMDSYGWESIHFFTLSLIILFSQASIPISPGSDCMLIYEIKYHRQNHHYLFRWTSHLLQFGL